MHRGAASGGDGSAAWGRAPAALTAAASLRTSA